MATPEGWSAAESELFDLAEKIASMQVQLEDKARRAWKGERWYLACMYNLQLARNAQNELKWLMQRAAELKAQADRKEANRLRLDERRLCNENESDARNKKAEIKVKRAQLQLLDEAAKKATLENSIARRQAEEEYLKKKLELLSSRLVQARDDLDALKKHLRDKYGKNWLHMECIEAGLMRCIYEDNLHNFSPEVQALALTKGIVRKRETA